MNKQVVIAIVVILVVLVGGYGGYRLYKHFKRVSAPSPVAQVTSTTKPTATPVANNIYKTATNAKLGSYLTDMKGMTLYTFTKDKPGVSNCTGVCLTIWPAYTASSAGGTLPANVAVITRPDKSLQYAYKGMPLYYYNKDKAPGDTLGQGVQGIWFVAKP